RRKELAEDVARLLAELRLCRQRRMCRSWCVDVLQVRPASEVLRRVDGAVVAEVEERPRVDLEVEVRRRGERVARVADEADHLARLDAIAAEVTRCVAGEVRVIELVAGAVADPEPPASQLLPTDAVDRS